MKINEKAQEICEGYADDGYSAGLYMGFKEGAEWMLNELCKWFNDEYPVATRVYNKTTGSNIPEEWRKKYLEN